MWICEEEQPVESQMNVRFQKPQNSTSLNVTLALLIRLPLSPPRKKRNHMTTQLSRVHTDNCRKLYAHGHVAVDDSQSSMMSWVRYGRHRSTSSVLRPDSHSWLAKPFRNRHRTVAGLTHQGVGKQYIALYTTVSWFLLDVLISYWVLLCDVASPKTIRNTVFSGSRHFLKRSQEAKYSYASSWRWLNNTLVAHWRRIN